MVSRMGAGTLRHLTAPPNTCLPRGPTSLACTWPGVQVLTQVARDVWRTWDPRLIALLASILGPQICVHMLVYRHWIEHRLGWIFAR